ncbi:response regulator transcription factor [Nocardiopsis metallicus]|uniref:DNA-binding response OmpR family regulator n=1 Tax=Nocardiopsis metallicus TaxID=179819 RepID=A0A840WFY9_9ACTN|nr:response regulator transcription factor [Nocardiopsis metallicus]MBB5490865.1 DNA-binding response OmpR family regulator [Nocardiopsis metallicus]
MATVLLVEDDQMVRGALMRALSGLGHVVLPVGTALDALREAAKHEPDLVILDLGLPDLDGAAALRMLRGHSDVPVIVATARGDEQSIVRLLNDGADDYVVKPFSSTQLAARMNALLRRSGRSSASAPDLGELTVGELSISLTRRQATLAGRPLELSRREFDLLAYLAEHAGRVVSRKELVEAVWHQHPFVGHDQTIDVHMSWLRRKLGESASRPRYLHTVRGVGLKLVEPA